MDTLIIFVLVVTVMVVFAKLAGNPLNHSDAFRRRRMGNWLPLGLTYAFLYMGRYNLTVSKMALGDLMTKEDFGIIFAAGTITYAFSFLVNGPLTDRIGGKRAMLLGAFGSSLLNAALGVLTYVMLNNPDLDLNVTPWFSVIYAANMYFQSFGAVAIVKVNSNWFHVRERGSFGGLFGVLISLGIFFAFDWGKAIVDATRGVVPDGVTLGIFQEVLRAILVTPEATVDPTWWVFFIPSIVLFVFAILSLLLVRDRPSQAGFADISTGDASEGEAEEPFDLGKLLKKIVTNPVILTIAFIEFCSGVMRNGVMHWFPIFARERGADVGFFFMDHWGLILCFAGITGGMLAGFISDKVFQSRRGPVAALLYGTMVVFTVLMAGDLFLIDNLFFLGVTVTIMSIAVIGVHGMLSGTATMDFGGRKAAGTAVGIIDGFVYLGTGLQSLSLGFITTHDWRFWPVFLLPFAVLGLVLAIRIWRAFPNAGKKK